MADRSVKALVKELNDSHGTSRQPMTIGTKLMLGHSIHDIIPRFWAKLPLIACRNSVNLINEAIGALRVAESCNGGSEGYGLDANNTFIVTDKATGEVTIELYLQDSKTKLPRWVDMADVTLGSKINVQEHYRKLWSTNGLTICPPRDEGGFLVEQPDSWAVKLSLLSIPDGFEDKLKNILKMAAYSWPEYKKLESTLLKYAKERHTSKKSAEHHSFVLLTEGQHSAPVHRWMISALESAGLGLLDRGIFLVPAPLLRSTCGGGRVLTPMPFLSTSVYDHSKKVFDESMKLSNPPGRPDPEFDLQGHATPRLGEHSWRRYANRTAQRNRDYHQLSAGDIDLYVGWNLKEHDRDMQEHYAGQDRAHRVKRRKITQMG